MAYAAITKSLIEEVTAKLNGLESAEIEAMPNPSNILTELKSDPEFRAQLVDRLWEPVADLRPRLEQYSVKARVNVHFSKDLSDGKTIKTNMEVNELLCPLTAPLSKDYYGPLALEMVVPCGFHPKFAEYFEAKAQRSEASERWKAVRTQVINFLKSCKSANEAMKLWPDVERYLPKDTIAKVNQKSEKAVKDESNALAALKAINIDAVNTSTVLARMAGAKL